MNKKLFKNKYFLTGGTVIMILLLLCFFAPVLTKYSYSDINLTNINKGPSLKHLLGTDELGRDVWTRILYGGRVSVTVGIVATAVQMFIGITLGLTAGYKGGIFDFIIMRIIDIIMCFPMFLAAIAISSVIGQSFINLILIISLLSWTEVARVVRAETLSLKTRDFVTASKVSGFSDFKIIMIHILQNIFSTVVVAMTVSMATVILMESSLSFFGLGIKDPMPSWGNLISSAQNLRTFTSYWWTWLPAGIIIILFVLSINFIGKALTMYYSPNKEALKEEVEIVKDFDLQINKGERIAIIGESGSGKSLTSLSMLGLNDKKLKVNGKIIFNNENLLSLNEEELRKKRAKNISIIFQEPMTALNPLVTVGKQVAEVFEIHTDYSKKEIKKKVSELFEELGFENIEELYNKYPNELSGGMRQRVVIAMAIALKPEFLIADEITTSIDYSLKVSVLNLIKELSIKYNMAVILITHDLDLLQGFADRVVVMKNGKIMEIAETTTFFSNPENDYSKEMIEIFQSLTS